MTYNEDNDEHVTRRTEGFFFEPVTRKRMTFPKCYYSRKPGHKIEKCCEYMRDLKIAKRERGTPCSCDDYGTISRSKEMKLFLHRRREVFMEDDSWDRASNLGYMI
uniref:Uncharacterized protein n=1 Tax=Tanacetum cinerariifolium TaxID=118510 RepID=A0A6L2LUV5_TANCI|nr:hypothetical protein [Tanacetum cinerariifolium]